MQLWLLVHVRIWECLHTYCKSFTVSRIDPIWLLLGSSQWQRSLSLLEAKWNRSLDQHLSHAFWGAEHFSSADTCSGSFSRHLWKYTDLILPSSEFYFQMPVMVKRDQFCTSAGQQYDLLVLCAYLFFSSSSGRVRLTSQVRWWNFVRPRRGNKELIETHYAFLLNKLDVFYWEARHQLALLFFCRVSRLTADPSDHNELLRRSQYLGTTIH